MCDNSVVDSKWKREYGPGASSRCEEYRILPIWYYSLRCTLFKYSNNADFISLLSFFRSCEFHMVCPRMRFSETSIVPLCLTDEQTSQIECNMTVLWLLYLEQLSRKWPEVSLSFPQEQSGTYQKFQSGSYHFWPTDRSGLCHRKSVCLSVCL